MNRLLGFLRRRIDEGSLNSSISTRMGINSPRQVEVTARSEATTTDSSSLIQSEQPQTRSASSQPGTRDELDDDPPLYDENSPPGYQYELLLINSPETLRRWFQTSEERRDWITRRVAGGRNHDLPAMSLEETQLSADRMLEEMISQRYPLQAPADPSPSPEQPLNPLERVPSISLEDWMQWHTTDTCRNLIHEYTLDGLTPWQAEVNANLYFIRLRTLTANRDLLRPEPIASALDPESVTQDHHDRLHRRLRGWGMSPSQVEDHVNAILTEEEQRESRAMMFEG
ncbi:hypothetical protein VTL71DRAFT_9882 [Oculimacula yallundae]|uniref:Uncharacterized protein n=1 Tax=Oculimacula yallundae TaxID=86028 RepID=A0ABR4BQY5_9HELO